MLFVVWIFCSFNGNRCNTCLGGYGAVITQFSKVVTYNSLRRRKPTNCEAVKTDSESLETVRKGFLNQAQKSPFSPAYTPSNQVGGLGRSGIRMNSCTQDVHIQFGIARCQLLWSANICKAEYPVPDIVEIPTSKEQSSS